MVRPSDRVDSGYWIEGMERVSGIITYSKHHKREGQEGVEDGRLNAKVEGTIEVDARW